MAISWNIEAFWAGWCEVPYRSSFEWNCQKSGSSEAIEGLEVSKFKWYAILVRKIQFLKKFRRTEVSCVKKRLGWRDVLWIVKFRENYLETTSSNSAEKWWKTWLDWSIKIAYTQRIPVCQFITDFSAKTRKLLNDFTRTIR